MGLFLDFFASLSGTPLHQNQRRPQGGASTRHRVDCLTCLPAAHGKNGPVHTPLRERAVPCYSVRRAWSTAFLNSAVIASAMPCVGLTSK